MKHFPERLLPLFVFALAFALVPLRQFDGLTLIPGDLGDARLNTYFLENIYQFLRGQVPSLWHLTFFYPYPWVLGFSDNLFGSSPVYLMARVLGAESDTSFQIWFLFGYAANFAAAYYALRRLGGSALAASLGALIFAFALPTAAHAGHAQLHYRFGIPLTLLLFAEFLDRKHPRALIGTFAWLVWQFYAGIYMGFFALVFMALMLVSHLVATARPRPMGGLRAQFAGVALAWTAQPRHVRRGLAFGFAALFSLLVLLFIPYLQVQALYGVKRHWSEISTMLPRPQSYVLSDGSWLWSAPDAALFKSLPMRHEHQMFIGLVPLLLAVAGLFVWLRSGLPHVVRLLVGAAGLMILITLNIGGISLWRLFYGLPLASAIRAMTRFDQVLLFPVGALAMIAVDRLRGLINGRLSPIVVATIFAACLSEMALQRASASEKTEWRARIARAEAALPAKMPDDAILFMAQRGQDNFVQDEIDAIWVALRHGIPTINGYSGALPPGAAMQFGTDCTEAVGRLLAYSHLVPAADNKEQYRALMKRVVLVGFGSCDKQLMAENPSITTTETPYSPEEVRHLSYEIAIPAAGAKQVIVTLRNSGDFDFAAWSVIDQPLRVSWRFRDGLGVPMSDWENRKNLPADIPAHGQINVVLPLKIPAGAAAIEISMVQEHVFWLHDLGIPTVTAPLP